MSLPSPAVNIPCSNPELRDVVYQVNRRFQDIEQLLGSVAVDATIPDRSLANVKLILGTITDDEIANVTITAGKLNIMSLSEITKAAGTLTSGKLQGFTIETTTLTSPTITTPTISGGSWSGGTFTTGDFTGKAIITSAGSEVGPFNVSAAKLYTGTVEHNGSQSYFGTGNDIAILDSTDGTYRLTIGNASYGSAPFRVTKAGVLTAVGPTITGATIGTSTITGGSISTASISNCSVAATVLTVDASSSVNIGAGTEIIFAGDTQLFRSSAGTLKTDGNFTSDLYVTGTIGGVFGQGSGSGRTDANAGGVQIYDSALANTVSISSAGTGYFLSSVRATGGFTSNASNVWKFGAKSSATVALDTTGYVSLTVDGVGYKLGLVT